MSKSKINIEVALDENKMPKSIKWVSADMPEPQNAKAMFISFFDEYTKDTLKLDLWIKEFEIGEMDRFMYYTIRSMADSYIKATNNTELADAMQKFAHYFGQKTGIIAEES